MMIQLIACSLPYRFKSERAIINPAKILKHRTKNSEEQEGKQKMKR